jgi:hypothetical protein
MKDELRNFEKFKDLVANYFKLEKESFTLKFTDIED